MLYEVITILGLAIYAGWLPAGGWDWSWQRMVLPVITLALPVIAYIARLMRGSMIEVLHSNYIRTARAKGMPESVVIRRHALKPALLPVISYMGPATAALITGSVVIERIYSIPGLGSYFVQGALNRDYTLVMGVVVRITSYNVCYTKLLRLPDVRAVAEIAVGPAVGER